MLDGLEQIDPKYSGFSLDQHIQACTKMSQVLKLFANGFLNKLKYVNFRRKKF